MKILNSKKSILTIICLLAIFAGIGAVYSIAKEEKGIIKFLNGPTPSITNAFLDKEKYFPGDQMAVTAETQNASEVKAFVENEKGFNEVNLVVAASFNGKETWLGKWQVENSLSGKKYKLKIIASNKSGTAETVLEWEDPNPGHPWSQIDTFPAACGGNDFVKGVGAALTCATPAGGSLNCTQATGSYTATNSGIAWSVNCPLGVGYTATGGGGDCRCIGGAGVSVLTQSIPQPFPPGVPQGWFAECSMLPGTGCAQHTVDVYVVCCK